MFHVSHIKYPTHKRTGGDGLISLLLINHHYYAFKQLSPQMADPLSIAASIAGLLAAAGKVYTVVSGFIHSTANAPQSTAATLEAVGEIKIALASVQSIIDSLHYLSASRKGLIQLEHLAIIITNAVLTLSKLESLVCQKDGFRYRLRWFWNEKRVLSLLPRLESQKTSLKLIVSVLQRHRSLYLCLWDRADWFLATLTLRRSVVTMRCLPRWRRSSSRTELLVNICSLWKTKALWMFGL